MNALRARITRMEGAVPVLGRFLVLSGTDIAPGDEARILAEHGEIVGVRDMVFFEESASGGASLAIIPVTMTFEDALAELDP